MRQKVEIFLEEDVIREAVKKAEEEHTSLEDFLTKLIEQSLCTSKIDRLTGILKDIKISEEEYKEHLKEKYL